MWANATPILTRLPRLPLVGTANSVTTGDWAACLADLERYRVYADDWDGQGAKAITADLIDGAAALVELLRSHAVAPPHCVVPGFEGTVGFQWDTADGGSVTLEITGPSAAEFEHFSPAEPALEVIKIGEPVAVELP